MFNDFLTMGAWSKLYLIAFGFGGALAALVMGLCAALGVPLPGVSIPLVCALAACLGGFLLCGIALLHRRVSMGEWTRGAIVYVALSAVVLLSTLGALGKL